MPWAHLDIAGTAMYSGKSEINKRHQHQLGLGWGVRLLDRLVAEHYEGVAAARGYLAREPW